MNGKEANGGLLNPGNTSLVEIEPTPVRIVNQSIATQSHPPAREAKMSDEGREKLDQAYDELEHELPDRVSHAIDWLRNPDSRWIRLLLGLVLIVAGFFGFLPILGFELIPIGLLLIAQDVPFLRKPIGEFTLWLVHKWVALRQWWQRNRQK
jgi:hypothetical protein